MKVSKKITNFFKLLHSKVVVVDETFSKNQSMHF